VGADTWCWGMVGR